MIDIGSITAPPVIIPTTSILTAKNRWDHFLARVGVRRGEHRMEPGLYALGNPTPESLVFVSANYTLSFDALRSSLGGLDAYILVLDTQGINVWCAAGKGTFGTKEIVRRVIAARLGEVVSHRKLILPQLGAPGVAAHEVKKLTGFWVEYGPVRAADLPEYLKTHEAAPEMRQVEFPLRDRVVLIPGRHRPDLPPNLDCRRDPVLFGRLGFQPGSRDRCLCWNRVIPNLFALAADPQFQHQGLLPGIFGCAPVCRFSVFTPPRLVLVAPAWAGIGISARHAGSHGFPVPEFHRLEHLHLAQRRKKGNVRLYPRHGLDLRDWYCPCHCFGFYQVIGDR